MELDIIAQRTLISVENPNETVGIEVARPRVMQDGHGWECFYRITTPRGCETRYSAGADALQSLQLALEIIGVKVGLIEKSSGCTFSYGQ